MSELILNAYSISFIIQIIETDHMSDYLTAHTPQTCPQPIKLPLFNPHPQNTTAQWTPGTYRRSLMDKVKIALQQVKFT